MLKKIKTWFLPKPDYENKLITAIEVVSVKEEVKKMKKAPAKKKTVAKKTTKKAPVKKGEKKIKGGGGSKPHQVK